MSGRMGGGMETVLTWSWAYTMHVLMRLATQGKLNAAFKSYLASTHKLEKITCGYKIYIFNRNRFSFSRQVFSNIFHEKCDQYLHTKKVLIYCWSWNKMSCTVNFWFQLILNKILNPHTDLTWNYFFLERNHWKHFGMIQKYLTKTLVLL